jgi:hypothetical protein
MKLLIGVVLAVVGVTCQAQEEGGLKKTTHAAPVVSSRPVTEAEADATFDRVTGLYKSVLHLTVSSRHSPANPAAPITRSEVIAEFVRLYKAAEPGFTLTPKPVPVEYSRLTFDKPSEKAGLIMMIQRGCVGTYGPLATGKVTTLTVQEFGDSVGFFLARVAECTHVSSTKWTPYLHGIN